MMKKLRQNTNKHNQTGSEKFFWSNLAAFVDVVVE
jgi:hypothetical protein